MADPNAEKIEEVKIKDLEISEGSNEELDDTKLDKIRGGGTYGHQGYDHT